LGATAKGDAFMHKLRINTANTLVQSLLSPLGRLAFASQWPKIWQKVCQKRRELRSCLVIIGPSIKGCCCRKTSNFRWLLTLLSKTEQPQPQTEEGTTLKTPLAD